MCDKPTPALLPRGNTVFGLGALFQSPFCVIDRVVKHYTCVLIFNINGIILYVSFCNLLFSTVCLRDLSVSICRFTLVFSTDSIELGHHDVSISLSDEHLGCVQLFTITTLL